MFTEDQGYSIKNDMIVWDKKVRFSYKRMELMNTMGI